MTHSVFGDAKESVGGVPVEVRTTRRETVWIEMRGGIQLIERILEDKAIATVKKAMNEYSETLMLPWAVYDKALTASTREIVDEMEGPNNFPLKALMGSGNLIQWVYAHDWSADKGHTADQWFNILGSPVNAPSFAQAMAMWQEALVDREVSDAV